MQKIIVIAALLASGAAWAGEGDMPIYPVEQRCKTHTMKDALAYADCIRIEQYSYDRAHYLRSEVSDEDRAACAIMADKLKAMNYMMLVECYDMKMTIARNKAETKAVQEGRGPKFRY